MLNNNKQKFTLNLSSTPDVHEGQTKIQLLEDLEGLRGRKKDLTPAERKKILSLMKMLTNQGDSLSQSVWNDILLVLALSPTLKVVLDP